MKKISFSIFIIIVLLFFSYEIINDAEAIINCVKYSFNIWINNLFPALFPFFIISKILINYGFVELISEFTKPIFCKLFKLNSNASFIFIMSMLTGLPSNAVYTKELYDNNKLTKEEATKIIMFSNFANPLFILGTISITFLNDKHLGIIVMISHYLGNIILGLILRKHYTQSYIKEPISIKKSILNMHNKRINQNIGKTISNAINSTIDTLLLILGVVTTFLIITTIIFNNFNLPIYIKIIVSSILEMTQGLKYVSLLSIPNFYKAIIITSIISFGGLSVHMQVMSILSDTIKYKPFLLARIAHAIISAFICFILLKLNV